MLQRIQSIFLILASAALLSLLSSSMLLIGVNGDSGGAGKLLSDGALTMPEDKILMGVGVSAAIIFFIAIFLYKNRPTQSKLVIAAVMLTIVMIILAALDVYANIEGMGGNVSLVPSIGSFIPFLVVLFGILALRYIKKDEKLVRSMNRLR